MSQAQIAEILEGLLVEAVWALDHFDPDPADPDGRKPMPAPERRLVDHGQITVDCPDMLAVLWTRAVPKLNLVNPRLKCTIITQVDFQIELRRCKPLGKGTGTTWTPPTMEQETEAALQLAADAQAIWKHLTELITTGQFPGGINQCDQVTMGGLEAVPPVGDDQGVRLKLTVTL